MVLTQMRNAGVVDVYLAGPCVGFVLVVIVWDELTLGVWDGHAVKHTAQVEHTQNKYNTCSAVQD